MADLDAYFPEPPEQPPPAPAEGPEPSSSQHSAPSTQHSGAPWNFIDLLFTLMTAFGSLLVAEFGGLMFLAVHRLLEGGPPSSLTRGVVENARFLVPVQLFAYAAVVLFVFLTARVKYKRGFLDAIQWRRVNPGVWYFIFAGIGMAILSQMIPVLFPSDRHFPLEKLFQDPVSGYLLAIFGVAFAPFVEELVFRGMLYPVLERRFGFETAVLGSALLFASIHAPQLAGGLPQLGAIFLVGVALGYARGRSGSLLPGFVMHTAYNATLFTAIIIGTKGFHELPA